MKLKYCFVDTYACFKRSLKNCCSSISNGFKKLFTRKKYVNMDDGETHFNTEYSSDENIDVSIKTPEQKNKSIFVPYYDGKLTFDKDGYLTVKDRL